MDCGQGRAAKAKGQFHGVIGRTFGGNLLKTETCEYLTWLINEHIILKRWFFMILLYQMGPRNQMSAHRALKTF